MTADYVIGKEYEFDGQYVKLTRIEGDEAVVESRFGAYFKCVLRDLNEKPPRKPKP